MTPSRAPKRPLQKNMISSESTLRCAYGAGTSCGCHPAMTGTKEHRENPLCGTLPDWNVWCIGGGVWVSHAIPCQHFLSKKNEDKEPSHPASQNEGWLKGGLVSFPPPCFQAVC